VLGKTNQVGIICKDAENYITGLLAVYGTRGIPVPLDPLQKTDSWKISIKNCTINKAIIDKDSYENHKSEMLENFPKYKIMDKKEDFLILTFTTDKKIEKNLKNTTLILHTSGTTGDQKAVKLSYKNLLHNSKGIIKTLGITEEDIGLLIITPQYAFGNSIINSHILAGSSIKLGNPFFPSELVKEIQEDTTIVYGTPNLPRLIEKGKKNKDKLNGAPRLFAFAGDKPTLRLLEILKTNYPLQKIAMMYGQTEATARVCCKISVHPKDLIDDIGPPLPGVRVKLVNSEGEEPTPGKTGEIWVSGPNIMEGYVLEEKTKDKIERGWLKTKDLGIKSKEGRVRIIGRMDNIINLNGRKVIPGEIEKMIESIKNIKKALVFKADGRVGPIIFSAVIKEENVSEIKLTKKIIALCKKKLPSYFIPKKIEFVSSFQTTKNGKISRRETQKALLNEVMRCKICGIGNNVPGVSIDNKNICNLCKAYTPTSKSKLLLKKKEIQKIYRESHQKAKYDFVLALSGGKDSSYSLNLLRKKFPESRILAITIDDGFLSKTAKRNCEYMCKKNLADHKIYKIGGKKFNSLLRELVKKEIFPKMAMVRASNLSTICSAIAKQKTILEAIKNKSRIVVFGWTNGQSFNPIVPLKKNFILWNSKILRSQIRHLKNKEIVEDLIINKKQLNKLDYRIFMFHPLLFENYTEKGLISRLTTVGWKIPPEKDANTSNCELNAFSTFIHKKIHGFNPYAKEISGLVRAEIITKEEGLKKIKDPLSKEIIIKAAKRLGLKSEIKDLK